MPNLLIDLEVDRVDLVDEGSNSAAHIKLFKRKERQIPMDFQEILKGLKPEHREVVEKAINDAKEAGMKEKMDELSPTLEKAKTDLADVTKRAEDAEAKVQSLETEISKSKPAEPNLEEVIKGLDPEVQKIFKSMEAKQKAAEEVAKRLQEEKDKEEAIAKAKELKNIPMDIEKLAEVVKGVSPEVFAVLKTANEAIAKGILNENGTGGDDNLGMGSDAAWAKLEKKAEEIASKDGITIEKAMQKAIKENKDLYKEYLKGGAN